MFSYGFLIDLQLSIIALWAVYFLVIHRRVSIKVSRVFLLLIIPVAFAVSTVKIPVFTQPAPVSEAFTTLQPLLGQKFIDNSNMEYSNASAPQTQTSEALAIEYPITIAYKEWSMSEIIFLCYLLGVLIMLIYTIISAATLAAIIRRSPKEMVDGREVIFTENHISACSFFGYIIVNESYRDSRWLNAVVLHENLHSRCHHTLDLLYMIFVRALLWFNPVSWHMIKLMRQVHEYEVDRKVVESGESLSDYMTLLIDSNHKKNPTLCNSLSYSLTKKRLMIITKSFTKLSYMRLVAVAPVIGVLICAFTLTSKVEAKAVSLIENVTIPLENQTNIVAQDTVMYHGVVKYDKPTKAIVEAPKFVNYEAKIEDVSTTGPQVLNYDSIMVVGIAYVAENSSFSSDVVISKYKDRQKGIRLKYGVVFPAEGDLPEVVLGSDTKDIAAIFEKMNNYKLDRRMIALIDPKYIESISVVEGSSLKNDIAKYRNSSEKVILVKFRPDISYHELSNFIRMNCGSSYGSLRSKDKSINSYILIKRHDGRMIKTRYPMYSKYSSLVSRINQDYVNRVIQIDALSAISTNGIVGVNGLTLVELKPFQGGLSEIMPEFDLPEEHQLIRWKDRFEHYEVPQSQVKISREQVTNHEAVLRVRHTDTETIVTMGYLIHFDSHWIAPNTNQVLENVENGDRYYFRRIGGDIPTGKILTFQGCRGKVVELDYVFPRLAYDVKEVVLYDISKSNYSIPLNVAPDRKHRIKIADYINKNTGKDIY